MTSALEGHPAFSARWDPASWQDDLHRWAAFLSEGGLVWEADATTRDLVERLAKSGSARSAEVIRVRLTKTADDALAAKGDARRVLELDATGVLYLLSPADRSALEGAGHRFSSRATAPLRSLATVPVTLGAYFVTQWACVRAGLDPNLAWIVALVAYVLTVRVVRGRWPLTRG